MLLLEHQKDRKNGVEMYKLGIVVSCYNEEEVIKITTNELIATINNLIKKDKIKKDSFILYIDDGSKDRTWELIKKEHINNPTQVKCVKLARNVGHQFALLAGLNVVKEMCDISISIDADLQDDILVIEDMVDQYHNGFDIVYGVRKDRKTDTFFKRTTAQSFYKIMNMLGVKTIHNHADFRLMSKRALEELSKYKESNLYLRGIVPLIGYNTTSVYYSRKERFAGESKYPFKKMMALALNGITSFSIKPITLVFELGIASILIAIIMAIYSLNAYFQGEVVTGWTSLILSIWFLGGLQLMAIGLIGQYIGKIYMEVKDRPRYNIEEILDKQF